MASKTVATMVAESEMAAITVEVIDSSSDSLASVTEAVV